MSFQQKLAAAIPDYNEDKHRAPGEETDTQTVNGSYAAREKHYKKEQNKRLKAGKIKEPPPSLKNANNTMLP